MILQPRDRYRSSDSNRISARCRRSCDTTTTLTTNTTNAITTTTTTATTTTSWRRFSTAAMHSEDSRSRRSPTTFRQETASSAWDSGMYRDYRDGQGSRADTKAQAFLGLLSTSDVGSPRHGGGSDVTPPSTTATATTYITSSAITPFYPATNCKSSSTATRNKPTSNISTTTTTTSTSTTATTTTFSVTMAESLGSLDAAGYDGFDGRPSTTTTM
ncbi:hypothetical protein DFJ73DRAFT_808892, partial [Zopfochytrium polystomum]